jgi:hypothetical protein
MKSSSDENDLVLDCFVGAYRLLAWAFDLSLGAEGVRPGCPAKDTGKDQLQGRGLRNLELRSPKEARAVVWLFSCSAVNPGSYRTLWWYCELRKRNRTSLILHRENAIISMTPRKRRNSPCSGSTMLAKHSPLI